VVGKPTELLQAVQAEEYVFSVGVFVACSRSLSVRWFSVLKVGCVYVYVYVYVCVCVCVCVYVYVCVGC
jgi:hypothetical protein